MKKLLRTLIIVFLLYYIFQFLFVYFQGGHDLTYEKIDGDNVISIREIAVSGLKDDDDNYSLELTVNNDVKFYYVVYYDFGRVTNIVDEVKYYEDSKYKCVYVKYIKDVSLNDVICSVDGVTQFYHTIKKPSDGLKEFVSGLKDSGYNSSTYVDSGAGVDYHEGFVYTNNLLENHFVGISFANGFLRINPIDKLANVISYKSDIVDESFALRGFVSNRYATVDYGKLSLNMTVYVHNVTDRYLYQFTANKIVSKDSYVLGTKGESLYILDPVNKKEYEIDLGEQNVLEVGNTKTGFVYYEAGKAKRTTFDKISSVKFTDYSLGDFDGSKYARIDKIGNNYGYYYLYEKVGAGYKVYRADISNTDNIMYIFSTDSIDKIQYVDNYVYYVSAGQLKYYSDLTGSKVIVDRCEYLNNAASPFYVYIKK